MMICSGERSFGWLLPTEFTFIHMGWSHKSDTENYVSLYHSSVGISEYKRHGTIACNPWHVHGSFIFFFGAHDPTKSVSLGYSGECLHLSLEQGERWQTTSLSFEKFVFLFAKISSYWSLILPDIFKSGNLPLKRGWYEWWHPEDLELQHFGGFRFPVL